MKLLTKWISHNQGLSVALLITAGLLIWSLSCQSQVSSLIDPSKMVNAGELNIEIQQEAQRLEAELAALAARARLKLDELDRQDAIKKKLFEFAAITAEAGTFNPAGLLGLAGGILGFGAVVDNRIKDKVIKNRPRKE